MKPIPQGARILVPIDFSDVSRAALEYAAQLGAAFDAQIQVFHAYETPHWAPSALRVEMPDGKPPVTLDELARREALERLVTFKSRVNLPSERRVEWEIDNGEAFELIMRRAKNFDLLVLGTHGRSGLNHFLIGSVAEKLVRHSPRPVITVRGSKAMWSRPLAHVDRAPMSRIVVGIDFSEASRQALLFAVDLSQRTGASLSVAHAVTQVSVQGSDLLVVSYADEKRTPFKDWARDWAMAQLEEFLASTELQVRPQTIVRIGPPVETLLAIAKMEELDLLVLGTHGRTGLSRLLMGSVAERVVRQAPCPVVTVRSTEPPELYPPQNSS